MSFKFRYASMLLGVTIVFVATIWLASYLLSLQEYLWLSIVAIALYGGMFWCGKKMAKVFFALSLMKFIRKKNGVVSEEQCYKFFSTMLSQKSTGEIREICGDVLATLDKNEVVERQGGNVILVG